MTFSALRKLCGKTNADIVKVLGVSRQLVAHWQRKGITATRQAWIREQLGKRQ